ncbi:Secretory immunoglobulin A-binding protein EsiB [Pontiella desulfatans]|uniref:Secretory immunoglobulin A-binding protein EsiB n=1 Tax=Pontiella desulfatans TaxID=2750659 RepID=A0A6C2UCV1_PONDE|nr:SEL1-like repeat protein [Pontiella desulfatans]VGO17204.1 Secretory immunoglobulin A-binding protein EsiB [Pontiella desulfatans]
MKKTAFLIATIALLGLPLLSFAADDIATLQQKAERGDAEAQCSLGSLYYEGSGVLQSYEDAAKWYQLSATQGNAEAQFLLGLCYSLGSGVPKSKELAGEWWHKAAEQGHERARDWWDINFGNEKEFYARTFADPEAAEKQISSIAERIGALNRQELFTAAENGDPEAQYELAGLYRDGKVFEKDRDKAIKWYRLAAAQQHKEALFALGLIYSTSMQGGDESEATVYFKQAAEAGHTVARRMMGAFCYEGSLVPQDYKKGARWFHLAALDGDMLSQHCIGLAYLYGKGVPQNSSKATAWFIKAAEQGDVKSQRFLGHIYRDEKTAAGISQNYTEAIRWYLKAAEQDDLEAQMGLILIFSELEEFDKAIPFAEKLARKGVKEAQYLLGSAYAFGKGGLKKDLVQAYAWLNVSAALGHEGAAELRSECAIEMSIAQLEEAQRISKEYYKKYAHPIDY